MKEIIPIQITVHDTRISKFDLTGRPDRKVTETVLEFYDKDFFDDDCLENKKRFLETLISVSLAALRGVVRVRFVPWTVTREVTKQLQDDLKSKLLERYEVQDLYWFDENYSETLYSLADTLEVILSQMGLENISIKIEQGDYIGRLTETTTSIALEWNEAR